MILLDMRPLIHTIHQALNKLTGSTFAQSDWSIPPKRELGDLAIPCFKLSKSLGKAPPAVAAELAPKLLENLGPQASKNIKSATAAGPYINIEFDATYMLELLRQQFKGGHKNFGASKIGAGKTLIIEFSSPNIAKEMALHHLRSTGIGNALSNIAALHGYNVCRINYLGDWGTSHGKNLLGLKLFGSEKDLLEQGLLYILHIYIRFNKEETAHPELADKAKAAFAQLEAGDPEYYRLWQILRDLSVKDYNKLYDRLGIKFDHIHGESMYVGKILNDSVDEITKTIGTRVSEGALVCDLPGHKIPLLLKKDDGASLYISRDLTALNDRWQKFHFDEAWYIVDIRQSLHFKQLFDLCTALKKPFAGHLKHVPFGMLKFGNAVMKTREGNIVYLNDVLDEAKKKALEIIKEKNPTLENAEETAEMIGMGSILFNDLSQHRERDVSFSWEQALSFDGDTAPFIQYTHARCASLIKKCEPILQKLVTVPGAQADILEHPAVRNLLGEIAYFITYCERALEDKDPSQISNASLNIAKSFNQLYSKVRFLDEKSQANLAALMEITEMTRLALCQGLDILGIKAPNAM